MIKLGKKGKTEAKTEKEKLDERREEVLARGRKFKYPLQYAKHKLVFNTIIIATVALIALIILGWAMLYKFQDTGDIIYRLTRVLPVSVANVDGEEVKFSDYLMIYRSSLRAVEQQSGQLGEGEDADFVRNEYKRSALKNAEEYAFALKIGKEEGVNVTNEEIKKAFDEQRKVGGTDRSEESFLKVISDNFGLSKNEYERLLYLSLMRAKVEEKIDTKANATAEKVKKMLAENGNDFGAVRDALGAEVVYEETGGLVDSKNVDGGRATVALGLEPGKQSGKFVSSNGDGYYFVKLIDKNETQVNYASIKVSFSEFGQRFSEAQTKEYIEIPE